MGAENSVLEGCEWGPQIDCPPKYPWEMSPVTKKDGSTATVFESKNSDSKDEELLRKSASILRGMRHPNIIRFIGCGQSSDGFWLATESVVPLFTFVSDISSQELCAGLFDLLHALDFLHSKLGVCHNNISLSSVYVGSDGTWKLGGLELACGFAEATQEFLERWRAFRHEDSLSPEDKTSIVRVEGSLGHARDVFAFGALVEVILDLIKEKDSCAQLLEQQLSMCLNPDPACRPQVPSLLNLSVFRSELIEILKFLRHVTAKTDTEKKEFFSNLMSMLYGLPEMAIARRLVVPLQARFVLLDEWAVAHVLPHLLTPKGSSCRKSAPFIQGLLPEHLFRQYVINHIYNIFHVYDCHVRLVLLEHFSHYVNMFTRQQLEDDIFLQILLGIRDTDDRLVAASLRALAELVPILGGDIVVGGVRKPFFFHGMPKISKMNAPQNVMAILTDHKPLLKNLAAARNMALKEKKMKEREQRREEARLKREESRNTPKEKASDKQQANSVQADGDELQKVSLVIEEVGGLSEEDATLKSNSDSDEDDDLKKCVSDINNIEQNDTAPDWSDWEDADQQISNEIEIELRAMPSTISTEPKVQTSPSPYRSHSPPSPPPVKVDWSEHGSEVDRSKKVSGGALHLGRQNVPKIGQTNNGEENVDSDIVHTQTWDTGAKTKLQLAHKNILSSVGHESIKLNGTTTLKQQQQSKKTSDKRVNDDLGAGLDIKSINIIKKSTLPDFFADMTPSITESKPSDFVSLLQTKAAESAEEQLPVSSISLSSQTSDREVRINSELFAVSAESDEDVKGWGETDDLDWEIEAPST